MTLSHESQELLSRVRREVEDAICSPPGWVMNRVKDELVAAILKSAFNQTLAESIGKAIADAFSQAVVLAVAQEFHRIAADQVEQGVRHLAYEVAALRKAIRRDLDEDEWWKQGPADSDEQDGGQDLPAE